jgi:hypothetical protein
MILKTLYILISDYEIPVHYRYIWKYLHSAYNNAAFVEACPPDEDIICHWSNKSQPLPVRKSNPNKPLYSFSIPVRTDRIMIEDWNEILHPCSKYVNHNL